MDKHQLSLNNLTKTQTARFVKTLSFVNKTLPPPATILDLGEKNCLGELFEKHGYNVKNTGKVNLDVDQSILNNSFDAVTAFEIFEHTLNPYSILKNISSKKLFATVPLRLWFSKAYRNTDDQWDNHFHEFEDWQFNWLLAETEWKIIRTEKWYGTVQKFGIRPFLRKLTPRFYAVEAER